MDSPHSIFYASFRDRPGQRQHRFMESADVNAAFGELFVPLRTNIRRGLSCEGQLYAIEMDACIPGELLGMTWLPPASLGIADKATLSDPARRRAQYDRLLSELRAESLFAYVSEPTAPTAPTASTASTASTRSSRLYVEIVSCDAAYVAEHPIIRGKGWHKRELSRAMHRRIASDLR